MQFIVDIYWRALGLLYIIAIPLVLVAVPAFVIAAFVYVLAAPELRMRMVGWAPGHSQLRQLPVQRVPRWPRLVTGAVARDLHLEGAP